ncbi:hypothetical protein Tco_0808595 [Tanacetum coccineum]
MIQPEPEGSTQGYPLDSVEVLRYDTKGEKVRIENNCRLDGKLTLGNSTPTRNIRVISFTMKMEILLEPTSNKLMVGDLCDSIRIKLVTTGKKRWCDSIRIKLVPERFYTSAGNPVKEILLKLNLPDHRILKDGGEDFRYSDTERLSRSDEVLKLKNFKKDATLKLSKSTNQEWYEHVGPEVTRSQDDKVTRWRNKIMLG